jgi:hypothetical protein
VSFADTFKRFPAHDRRRCEGACPVAIARFIESEPDVVGSVWISPQIGRWVDELRGVPFVPASHVSDIGLSHQYRRAALGAGQKGKEGGRPAAVGQPFKPAMDFRIDIGSAVRALNDHGVHQTGSLPEVCDIYIISTVDAEVARGAARAKVVSMGQSSEQTDEGNGTLDALVADILAGKV